MAHVRRAVSPDGDVVAWHPAARDADSSIVAGFHDEGVARLKRVDGMLQCQPRQTIRAGIRVAGRAMLVVQEVRLAESRINDECAIIGDRFIARGIQ